ncbi:DgyrCDS13110 [Dimorphilus gyrociliatus]|uniref:DgyrCDS13110 n=2 Tax=Dimorphilus gyrociliatus TaxID=2664684 RepID=A0A7I8W9S5_9ANNE|nr:DgyrCDS13110 [Dimorphilus gyrociliatus]
MKKFSKLYEFFTVSKGRTNLKMENLEPDESEVEILPNANQTDCPICINCYIRRNPRILPCAHTFCSVCLEQYALSKRVGVGDTLACPTCETHVKWPSKGSLGFPKNNYFIERDSAIEGATAAVSVIIPKEDDHMFQQMFENNLPDISNCLKQLENHLIHLEHEKFNLLSKIDLCRLLAIDKMDKWVSCMRTEVEDRFAEDKKLLKQIQFDLENLNSDDTKDTLNVLLNEKEALLSKKLSLVSHNFSVGELKLIEREIILEEYHTEEIDCYTITACCLGPDNHLYILIDKYRTKDNKSKVFVIERYSADGKLIEEDWSCHLEGDYRGLALDCEGNMYLCDKTAIRLGRTANCIVKILKNGTLKSRILQLPDNEELSTVAVDSTGIYVGIDSGITKRSIEEHTIRILKYDLQAKTLMWHFQDQSFGLGKMFSIDDYLILTRIHDEKIEVIHRDSGEKIKNLNFNFKESGDSPAWPSSIAPLPMNCFISAVQKLKQLFVFDKDLNVLQKISLEKQNIPVSVITWSNLEGNFLLLHYNCKLDRKRYLSFRKILYK